MDNQIIAEPSDKCIFNTYEDPEQWNNAYDNNFTKKEKTIEEDDLDIERIYFNGFDKKIIKDDIIILLIIYILIIIKKI